MRLPVTGEGAAAQAGGEGGHCIQHLVHVRHHVGAIDLDAGAPGRPQRHVKHGAALGRVDLLTREHGIAPFRHAARLRQLQQEAQGLVRDPVLRVVEEQTGALGGEARRASGIVGEQRAQMETLDLRVMRDERLPDRHRGQRGPGWSRGHQARTLLLASMAPNSPCQDSTKPLAPSDCSRAASAVRSIPALACAANTASASPPSRGSGLREGP